jgi:thiamine-monophosphate kinase
LVLAGELGEREIIDIILEHIEPMPRMPVPFGDDATAVDIGDGKLAVLKTDMLVGQTDVPQGMNLWQAARKAVVMNISDLAAKGVQPEVILAALGIPRGFARKDVEQVGKGLNAGAREYGAYVLGGDTNEASDLVISCTAFGVGDERTLVKRSGAQPGDFVAVTGSFGKTSSGLKVLLENLAAPSDVGEALRTAVFMPRARLKEGLALAGTHAVTASIDSSDGLAWSLHELSNASNVGFLIETLPAAQEARKFAEIHSLDLVELSMYGGEEYELVVTVKSESWLDAKSAAEAAGGALAKIGMVTKEKRLILKVESGTIPIQPKGWEHFRRP